MQALCLTCSWAFRGPAGADPYVVRCMWGKPYLELSRVFLASLGVVFNALAAFILDPKPHERNKKEDEKRASGASSMNFLRPATKSKGVQRSQQQEK